MNLRALSDLGGCDEPLNPGGIRFMARSAAPGSCAGCIFSGQRASVCREATRVALRACMPDCDDGFVYVAYPVDPRQTVIEGCEMDQQIS